MTPVRPLFLVDAFTDRPYLGNPAAVVLDADGLTDDQRQQVASELNRPGTAFVERSVGPGSAWRLRWFTPACEVAYSGHSTLAAVHVLRETGRLSQGRIGFDTKRGMLPVDFDGATGMIWLLPGIPRLTRFEAPHAPLLEAIGIRERDLGPWARPSLTPESDLLLPLRGLAPLRALAPDMLMLGRLARAAGIRGICVVATETVEPGSRSHCRFFAPHVGIPEDIVTGSVHSSLGIWLLEARVLGCPDRPVAFTAEQGDGLGRPGRLRVEIDMEGDRPTAVRVGGHAATVARGTLVAP